MKAAIGALACALLLAGCRCPRPVPPTPLSPAWDFGLSPTDPLFARLAGKDQAIRTDKPSVNALAQSCADTFNTQIAGVHCDARTAACCEGGCSPADAKEACAAGRATELRSLCCAQASGGFFRAFTACSGMALSGCVLSATGSAPKPLE